MPEIWPTAQAKDLYDLISFYFNNVLLNILTALHYLPILKYVGLCNVF